MRAKWLLMALCALGWDASAQSDDACESVGRARTYSRALVEATENARAQAAEAKLDAVMARDRRGEDSARRAEQAALDANDLAIRLDRELAAAQARCDTL